MPEKAITDMDYDAFQTLMDEHIERTSQQSGEMPASTFFELLFARMAEQVTETIEVEGEIIDDQLILRMPLDEDTAVQVKDNEILIGDRRIVVKLKNGTVYPRAG